MPIWGVDSYSQAHLRAAGYPAQPVISMPEGSTLYDYVVRRRQLSGSSAPQFWGRYINNFSTTSGPEWQRSQATVRLTTPEVEYLHQQGCKVLVIYNGILRDGDLRSYSAGRARAIEAIRLANQLHVPSSVRIYGDLEGWYVGHEWLSGWCDEFESSRFVGSGGIYGHVATQQIYQTLENQRIRGNLSRRYYWSESILHVPAAPPRQQGTTSGSYVVPSHSPVGQTASQSTRSIYIWSNRPYIDSDDCTTTPSTFTANRLSTPNINTEIWQYAHSCWQFPGQSGRTLSLIDMNVATNLGFQAMW